jgi:hypothetical protein
MEWNSSMRSSRLALPRLLFLWCYEVFHGSIPFHKRVALVFRDIIFVINILYLWHLVIYEHFMSVCVEQLILGTHAMSTWFWHKNRVWHLIKSLFYHGSGETLMHVWVTWLRLVRVRGDDRNRWPSIDFRLVLGSAHPSKTSMVGLRSFCPHAKHIREDSCPPPPHAGVAWGSLHL